MAVAASLQVPIPCVLCDKPFHITVPMRTEPGDGYLTVVVDEEDVVTAVRAHARQHMNWEG